MTGIRDTVLTFLLTLQSFWQTLQINSNGPGPFSMQVLLLMD